VEENMSCLKEDLPCIHAAGSDLVDRLID
jgi:hypothetical protein